MALDYLKPRVCDTIQNIPCDLTLTCLTNICHIPQPDALDPSHLNSSTLAILDPRNLDPRHPCPRFSRLQTSLTSHALDPCHIRLHPVL